MSDRFKTIYSQQAELYDRLVSREDYAQRLLPALRNIRTLSGCGIVEMGAGTGRLTRLLAPHARSIHAYDASAHMLAIAENTLRASGTTNWSLAVGENDSLPAPTACADLAIAGWSFGHCCDWFPDRWREEIGKALAEMRRVLRPGGTAIILETLGTGSEEPAPPTVELARYYEWLENEHGFSATMVRTDYRFASAQEADELLRFFFGDDFADQHCDGRRATLPECTGLWWRSY